MNTDPGGPRRNGLRSWNEPRWDEPGRNDALGQAEPNHPVIPLFGGGAFAAPGGNGANPLRPDSPLAALDQRETFGTPGPLATYNGDGFSAEFAGTPEVIPDTMDAPPLGKMKMQVVALAANKDSACFAMNLQVPVDLEQTPGGSQILLKTMMDGFAKGGKDEFWTGSRRGRGRLCREGSGRRYPHQDDRTPRPSPRIASISSSPAAKAAGDQLGHGRRVGKRFINSIKITYKGGDQVAAGAATPRRNARRRAWSGCWYCCSRAWCDAAHRFWPRRGCRTRSRRWRDHRPDAGCWSWPRRTGDWWRRHSQHRWPHESAN